MAEHKVEYATATGNDYPEHEATYLNVMRLAKIGTLVSLVVVVSLGIWGTVGALGWVAFGIFGALFVAFPLGLARDTVVPAVGLLVLMLLVWALLA